VNPQAGLSWDLVSETQQWSISALNFVIQRDRRKFLEIAPQLGLQTGNGGLSGLVGGQIVAHPNDTIGIVVSGGGEISNEGIRWGAFTLGVQVGPP
jgi:hypothetical protein